MNRKIGLGFLIFILVIMFVPVASLAYDQIYSLRKDVTQIRSKVDNSLLVTTEQNHWFIQFEQDDNFEFIIPDQQMISTTGAPNPYYNQGFTFFMYEDQGILIPILVPNRLLKARNALVAAKNYFKTAAQRAGFDLRWWKSDEPIEVVIGQTYSATAIAQAAFWHHRIVIKPQFASDIHATAVHEYFHLVTNALFYDGNEANFWQAYSTVSQDPYQLFLNEMTAEWATDEPIQITRTIGGQRNLDDLNDYLSSRSRHFIRRNPQAFFEKNEYNANLFIKYFAEQTMGKTDQSSAENVMNLIKNIYGSGGVNNANFFRSIIEMIPETDFGPGGYHAKWGKFFRAFCLSNLVQKASNMENPQGPIGYHDDAFTSLQYAHPNIIEKKWTSEASVHSDRVYQEPADDDTERKNRLIALLNEQEVIDAMAYKLHRIVLNSDPPQSRPVFFYAEGQQRSDIFLARQKREDSTIYRDRNNTTFDWKPDFTLANGPGTDSQKAYTILEDYGESGKIQDIWVGLVNSKTDGQHRFISWAFQASPRLIPYSYAPLYEGSSTIHLDGGSAASNSRQEGWYNGDTFKLKFQATGPVHKNGTNLEMIPLEDMSLELKFLNDQNQEVALDLDYGIEIKAAQERTGFFTYALKGKIAKHNPYVGNIRTHLKLTSLLNLGPLDQQIDESYEFNLRPVLPHVERVVISQDDSQVIYDSLDHIREIAKDKDNMYRLTGTIYFSLPMDSGNTLITSGIAAPYDKYFSQRNEWDRDKKICKARFKIPKTDIPSQGALLRFSISGPSYKNEDLDANIIEPGPQPNEAHFIYIGIDEFYDLSLWAKTVQKRSGYYGKVTAKLGPVQIRLRLMPYRRGNEGQPNVYVRHYANVLLDLPRQVKLLQKQVKANEDDYKAFKHNQKEMLKAMLKDKKNRLKIFKKGFQTPVKVPGGYPYDFKKGLQRNISSLKQSIQDQESNNNLAQALLSHKKKMWVQSKKQLDFVVTKIVPGFEAMTRLMFGLRHFTYNKEFSEPVYVSFAGATLEGQPSGWYSENYSDYQGKQGEYRVYTIHSTTQGWVEQDYRGSRQDSMHSFHDPILWVWDIKRPYLKIIKALADLSGAMPDYMYASYDSGPPGGIWEWDNTPLVYIQKQAAGALSTLPDRIDWQLLEISKRMWDFFPKKQRPDFDRLVSRDRKIDKAALQLPDIVSQRIYKLKRLEEVARDLPIHSNGYEIQLSYNSSHIGGPSMGILPPEDEVIERPGVYIHRKRIWYEPGFWQKKEVRLTTEYDWAGFRRPPGLFGLNPYEIVPHQTNYLSSIYSNVKPVTWSLGQGTGTQLFDENIDNLTFYVQSEEPLIEGTIRGIYQHPAISSRDPLDLQWESKWQLEHVGEIKVADIEIDIPAITPGVQEPGDTVVEEPAQPDSPPEPRSTPYASSYDPQTGITTESRGNPDGSRTVKQIDKDGNVISTRNEPGPGQGLPSASSFDPDTGMTTSSQRNSDGTVTIIQEDRQGNIVSQEVIDR
ncbi:MAG: hypothetical protein GY699_14100 [Desulfobacteraceae bacterium]|nr:hypothetical protein [Desulfobacteraceae bacterium]